MISNSFVSFSRIRQALHNRSGQSLAEYALVLSFVSLLSVVFMSTFTVQLHGVYSAITVALQAVRAVL
jgi:Flp pilus assembly pilin Flp